MGTYPAKSYIIDDYRNLFLVTSQVEKISLHIAHSLFINLLKRFLY